MLSRAIVARGKRGGRISEPEGTSIKARKANLLQQRLSLRERQLALAHAMMGQAEKQAKKLTENYDQWGWLGGYEDVIDRIRQPGKELYAPMSTVNDRRHGHNWPFWRTWAEHARLRASARLLCQLSPIASGALTGLRSFVLGTGFSYRTTTEVGAPSGLIGAVQNVIDEFLYTTSWCQIEREGFDRTRRDGELFLLHEEKDKHLHVEIIEPEQVQAPYGEAEEWTYGIETDGRQTHKPLSYNVVEDPGEDGQIYDPEEMHHLKINVDAKVKRGLTDFCYDTHDAIRTAGRLIDNVGQGAAIQASISLIRQHETASPSQVRDFVTAASDYDRYDPIAGRQEYSEGFRPGRVLDIDAGQNYVVPPFASNVGGYIEVVQGILRSVAVRWNAPEWLISSDASNTNYASSVTAESPFVKRCYAEQETYKTFFVRSIWAAIRVAAKHGRIRAYGRKWSWEEIRQVLDVQVEAPHVETRDTARESSTNKTYIDAGVKSIQTTQQELGLDSERERANIAAWKAGTSAAPAQGQGGGNPDDPTATLRGSVGGSQALMAIQTAYYAGTIPREACIANARIVYGFEQGDAEALFPEIQPTKMNPEQVGEAPDQGGGMAAMLGGGGEEAPAVEPDVTPDAEDDAFDGNDLDDGENPLDALLFGGDEPERPETGLSEAERKDKLGRRMCFDDETGKRIPCGSKSGGGEKKPAAKQATAKQPAAKKAPAKKAGDVTDEDVDAAWHDITHAGTALEIVNALIKHSHATIKALAKERGENANGSTLAIAQRILSKLGQTADPKPAAAPEKKQPEKQPEKATEQSVLDAFKGAYTKLNKEGTVKIPELFDAIAERVPGLTSEQFGKMLLKWKEDDLITLQVVGHRDAEPRSSEGIEGQKGMYFYVVANDDPASLKLPAGRDKPAPASKPAEKPAPAKRTPAARKGKPKEA